MWGGGARYLPSLIALLSLSLFHMFEFKSVTFLVYVHWGCSPKVTQANTHHINWFLTVSLKSDHVLHVSIQSIHIYVYFPLAGLFEGFIRNRHMWRTIDP